MRFTVLGSGTAYPDPDRGPAGFLLETPEGAWLVDGGSGTVGRCAAAGVDPRTLRGGFYTHRHADHCADLIPLLFSFKMPPARRAPYPLFAGRGFSDFYAALIAAWNMRLPCETPIHELSLERPDEVTIGSLVLRSAPAVHGHGALHLRFEWEGRSVVFSGDTGPSAALTALARDTDLLVCECAGDLPGHLGPTSVADLVARARPAEVWLTHFYPDTDPTSALQTIQSTGIPVRRAQDGDCWSPDA